jgi:hypothetical protein
MPYAEGALGADVAAKVERHTASCARCAAELEMIRSVTCALGAADVPAKEPANDLWAKVSARIADESARPASSPRLGIAAGFAAAVLVGVVGIKLLAPNMAPVATRDVSGVKRVAEVTSPAESKNAKEVSPAPQPEPKPEVKQQPGPQPAPEPPAGKPSPNTPERRYFASKNDSSNWYLKAKPAERVEMASAALRGDEDSDDKAETHFYVNLTATSARTIAPAAAPVRPATAGSSIAGVSFAAVPPAEIYSDLGNARAPARSFVDALTPAGAALDGSTVTDNDVYLACDLYGVKRASPVAAAAPAAPARAAGYAFAAGTVSGNYELDSASRSVDCYWNDTTRAVSTASVVDDLNETEGIRTAAIFSY